MSCVNWQWSICAALFQIIIYVLLHFQQYVSGIVENGVPWSTSLTSHKFTTIFTYCKKLYRVILYCIRVERMKLEYQDKTTFWKLVWTKFVDKVVIITSHQEESKSKTLMWINPKTFVWISHKCLSKCQSTLPCYHNDIHSVINIVMVILNLYV